MDIAALSIDYSLSKTQTEVGIQVLKKIMDTSQTNNAEMLAMLVPPSATLGNSIDVSI
ncbi:hypothetical protein P22_3751 [Propionispora sp. 2/2-37]|uniref:YjfB family protein n=1 Tax=Propionispora sp. 2/2-37 TaxID=1677858 RepID=UPI0006C67261|nr:YjfB family protein [Propionispora sp. 2/2-37]CUH97619.1 hypothetical protein P22_3751 [Propionispora sp. 2/2-37]